MVSEEPPCLLRTCIASFISSHTGRLLLIQAFSKPLALVSPRTVMSACSDYILLFILRYLGFPAILIPHLPEKENKAKRDKKQSYSFMPLSGRTAIGTMFSNHNLQWLFQAWLFSRQSSEKTLFFFLCLQRLREMVKGLALIPSVDFKSLQLLRP